MARSSPRALATNRLRPSWQEGLPASRSITNPAPDTSRQRELILSHPHSFPTAAYQRTKGVCHPHNSTVYLKVRDAVPSEVVPQRHRRVRQHHDGRENPILHLRRHDLYAAQTRTAPKAFAKIFLIRFRVPLLLGVSHGPARELERLPSAFPRFLSNRSLPSLIAAGKSQFQSHQSEDRKPAQATERGFRDWRRGPARRHCARL